MSANKLLVFFFVLKILCATPVVLSAASSSISNSNTNLPAGVTANFLLEWNRNFETQIARLGDRISQLMVRMDHLDARVGRVQSLVQMRFDNIDNGLTTAKLRMDLWGDELNRIEEQLTRKWKNLDSRFDLLANNMESKLDAKMNSIQRDNRRHNEFLATTFNTVVFSNEKLHEKITVSVAQMNESMRTLKDGLEDKLCTKGSHFSPDVHSGGEFPKDLDDNTTSTTNEIFHLVQELVESQRNCSKTNELSSDFLTDDSNQKNNSSSSPHLLIVNKVTNMFEDLLIRSTNIDVSLRELRTVANITRKDVQDGFRALFSSQNSGYRTTPHGRESNYHNGQHHRSYERTHSFRHHSLGSQHYENSNNNHNSNNNNNRHFSPTGSVVGASSELMSAVIIEALASSESMSTALGRRMTELSRSIEERFEMISMTLNGFLESCIRIQEGSPLVEEHIARVLERLLDTVENSTDTATQLWFSVADEIVQTTTAQSNCSPYPMENSRPQTFQKTPSLGESDRTRISDTTTITGTNTSTNNNESLDPSSFHQPSDPHLVDSTTTTRDFIHSSSLGLTEEQKSLWNSLFPSTEVPE